MSAVILVSILAVAACSKDAKPRTTTPSRGGGTSDSSTGGTAGQQEVASGDLRDALVHLQRVHFGLDTDTLLPAARTSLEDAAVILLAHKDVQLFVDGHTDDRGTTEYNIGLGDRRANAVVDYLARLGIDRSRLQVVSFGEETPWHDGDHAANRRVEFRLMRGTIQLVLDDGVRYGDDGAPQVSTSGTR
jgi:peptidoglycan-associated lipoprotein